MVLIFLVFVLEFFEHILLKLGCHYVNQTISRAVLNVLINGFLTRCLLVVVKKLFIKGVKGVVGRCVSPVVLILGHLS